MTKRFAYTYVLLRYRHDPWSGEFANVGVVLHSPHADFVGVRVRKTLGRLGKMFPGLVKSDLTSSLSAIERAVCRLAPSRQSELISGASLDAKAIAARALPADDSSYVWGPLASGVTNDPAVTLDYLFKRFVAQYDEDSFVRRDDAAVWQPVREKLAEKHLLERLQPKTVISPIDEVHFGNAWKNGAWHCYQALSFDLMTSEGIREKAARWSGHMLGVSKAPEDIRPYFLVGAPSDPQLAGDYRRAIELLRVSALSPAVFEEPQVDELVNEIERQVHRHDSGH